MKLHEFQAKKLITKYGANTPKGELITSVDQIDKVAAKLGAPIVVKAQIHAGGRGKGGGVKVCQDLEQAKQAAKNLLGSQLITPQTSAQGQLVSKLLLEEGVSIAKEYYLSILMDRQKKCPLLMASTAGGVDIEEVAASQPEAIIKEYINPLWGLRNYQLQNLIDKLQLNSNKQIASNAAKLIKSLYDTFIGEDASLLEINPLITTTDGQVIALDCKMILDDNGLNRHKYNLELRDTAEEDPAEIEASTYDLSYVKLDGNIGCMVNGAGLAMATMDIIKLHGGNPANFLDVGGNATQSKVEAALKLICSDKNVACIFINIFGGIVRCDMIAEGIVGALNNFPVDMPIVVRLQGNNAQKAQEIINNSSHSKKLTMIDNLTTAAKQAVQLTK